MFQTPHQARHAAVHIRPRMQLAAEGLPEAPAQAPGELPRGSLRPTGGDARDGQKGGRVGGGGAGRHRRGGAGALRRPQPQGGPFDSPR